MNSSNPRSSYARYAALLAALACAAVTTAHAENVFITNNTDWNTSTPPPSYPDDTVLVISHATNNPKLTLDTGGSNNWQGATVVGGPGYESGRLDILGGAVLQNTGAEAVIGNIGGRDVRAGIDYVGLNAGSTGSVLVSGAGSEWRNVRLQIGEAGNGTLLIENGGKVVTSNRSEIGVINAAATGLVTVNGVGSSWSTVTSLQVGLSGKGTLKIENGGTASAQYVAIGNGASTPGGLVTVDGTNSKFISTGRLYVAQYGKGELQITDGGAVSNANGYIGAGNSTAVQGKVTVGADSTWSNSGFLVLGGTDLTTAAPLAKGELIVQNGGTVTVAGTTRAFGGGSISIQSGGIMTVNGANGLVSDGEVSVFGNLTAVNGVTINSTGIVGGDGIVAGNLTLNAGAQFQFTLDSTLTVTGTVSLDTSFGIDDLLGLDSSIANGSYTLINGTSTDFSLLNIQNWGVVNAYDLGDGKSAYFRQGSLIVEVVPEPSIAALLGLAALAFLRRRKMQ